MAYADYIHCDDCDCKVIYDGGSGRVGAGEYLVLCAACRKKREAVHAQLLEACKAALDEDCGLACAEQLRAAIASAEGEQAERRGTA